MAYYPYYSSYSNPTQYFNPSGYSLYHSAPSHMMTGPMISTRYGINNYAGIYPDMSMASQIYARDGAGLNAQDVAKTVLQAILSAIVRFDVTELLTSIVNN